MRNEGVGSERTRNKGWEVKERGIRGWGVRG